MTPPFHMLHLPLLDRWPELVGPLRQREMAGDEDLGYRAHRLLSGLFGELSPKPFALISRRTGGSGPRSAILAYAEDGIATYSETARGLASPDLYRAVLWESAADKPMPSAFRVGARFGFEVRCCPVVRVSSRHGGGRDDGSEVDAFLRALDIAGHGEGGALDGKPHGLDRREIYREWFRHQVARLGGAELKSDLQLTGMRRLRLARRGRSGAADGFRQLAALERPEATFAGTIEVTDAERFFGLVRRGIGRHRAFGFGMLLLKPARPAD